MLSEITEISLIFQTSANKNSVNLDHQKTEQCLYSVCHSMSTCLTYFQCQIDSRIICQTSSNFAIIIVTCKSVLIFRKILVKGTVPENCCFIKHNYIGSMAEIGTTNCTITLIFSVFFNLFSSASKILNKSRFLTRSFLISSY